MKHIIKRVSPKAFEDWKVQNNPNIWGDFPSSRKQETQMEEEISYYSKEELRLPLLEEQGFICCYCNRRIENINYGLEGTVIEHLNPRDEYPEDTFIYNNLLASCRGGNEVRPPENRFCDASKDKDEISVNPLQGDCEAKFNYLENGNVMGVDNDAQETIETLNLDCEKLKNLREQAILGFDLFNLSQEEIKLLIQGIDNRFDGKFTPFCSVIKSVLKNLCLIPFNHPNQTFNLFYYKFL